MSRETRFFFGSQEPILHLPWREAYKQRRNFPFVPGYIAR
nr:MAG TPA: hypothetical protein [Caudoviricetes sp.]